MASTSTPAVGYRPGDPAYRRVMVAMFAAGVATFSVLYIPQALLPQLETFFGVGAAQATLTISFTTMALGVALLVAGPASELVGRTRLMHLALWLSGAVALASALAPDWRWLLTLRLVQGVVLAGVPATATAYLREEIDRSAQTRAVGLYIAGTATGGLLGRLVSGVVADGAGWRWGFAAVAVISLLCAALVGALLPRSNHFVARSPRPRQILAMTREVMTVPRLWALYAVGGLSMAAFVGLYNATTFRLAAPPFGLGSGAAGAVFLVYLAGTVSSTLAGRLAERFGRGRVALAGCLVTAAGVVLTAPASLPLMVLGLAVMTAGFFVVHGIASGWVPVVAHSRRAAPAQAASLYLVCYYAGSSLGGWVAGGLWAAAGWSAVVYLSLSLIGAAAVLCLLLQRPRASA